MTLYFWSPSPQNKAFFPTKTRVISVPGTWRVLNYYVGSQEGFFQLNFGVATAEKSPIETSSMDSIESSQNGQKLQESKGWWNIKDAPLAGNRRWRLGLPLKAVQGADAIRSWHGRNSYTRVEAKIYHLGGSFKCLLFFVALLGEVIQFD